MPPRSLVKSKAKAKASKAKALPKGAVDHLVPELHRSMKILNKLTRLHTTYSTGQWAIPKKAWRVPQGVVAALTPIIARPAGALAEPRKTVRKDEDGNIVEVRVKLTAEDVYEAICLTGKFPHFKPKVDKLKGGVRVSEKTLQEKPQAEAAEN